MSIARRIKSAEAHLPKPPDSDAEKLRRRLMHASEAAFFAGIFGDYYADYLAAAECSKRSDREGALTVAERVDAQTDGVAGAAFIGLDLAPLSEPSVIRLQGLVQTSHPLCESAIAEIREIIFSAFPTDYGFPR